jgi:endoplasmic reticulum junction formation protein lunapark
MKERRDKVEEIKKKTNYYSTRDLIQRYDVASPATPLRPRVNPGQPLPITPQQHPFLNSINTNGKAVNPALQAQLSRASILLPFVSDGLLFFSSHHTSPCATSTTTMV